MTYKLIAFDGDDTLWHNEPLFRDAHIRLQGAYAGRV